MKPISRRNFLKAITSTVILAGIPSLAACHPAQKHQENSSTAVPSKPTATPLPAVTPVATAQEAKLPFFQRNWQRAVNPYILPDWFLENRVQGHTRLSFIWIDKPEFEQAAQGFKGLGANVFTRHVKTADEDPWWSSALPLGEDGKPLLAKTRQIGKVTIPLSRNLVNEMVANAHQAGMHMIAYYRHIEEKTLADLHPDWVCHNLDGTLAMDQRGTLLDMTGPYREVVLQRLLELADMGVDGFYFDESHLPYNGCYQTSLQQSYQQVPSQNLPKTTQETDPGLIQYLDFQSDQVEKAFIYWRDTVKQRYPGVVFIISTTYLTTLTNRRMTTNLACIADSAKNEYDEAINGFVNLNVFNALNKLVQPAPDIRNALGLAVLRDASDGRPPHIWAPGFPSPQQKVAFAAAVITYGGVANIDVTEQYLLESRDAAGETERAGSQQAFALGAKVAPYLGQAQPLHWAAVHFSELSRNQRGGNPLREWREVLWPFTGAFQELLHSGVPVGIVNDRQLDRGLLDGYRLLFLPNPDELLPAQQNAVRQFKAAGGKVIENQSSWQWSTPQGNPKAVLAFRSALQKSIANAPVQVTGGDGKCHAVTYHNPQNGMLVVALTQDFSWLQLKLRGKDFTDPITPPPPALQNIIVKVMSDHLPGRVSEPISGQTLTVEKTTNGYQVVIPPYSSMALMVAEA